MQYTVFLKLDPYLAQWFQHECGGEYPIRLKRGSIEADLLACYLKPQPKDKGYVPQLRPNEGEVEIVLPYFKWKDIRTNNYLPPRAAIVLQECIRTRFRVALWKDLHTVGNVVKRTDVTISAWMKEHGIAFDDKNWNTIAKILQRKRAVYCPNHRLSNRKTSKHRKKGEENATTSETNCPPANPVE